MLHMRVADRRTGASTNTPKWEVLPFRLRTRNIKQQTCQKRNDTELLVWTVHHTENLSAQLKTHLGVSLERMHLLADRLSQVTTEQCCEIQWEASEFGAELGHTNHKSNTSWFKLV